VRGGAGNHPARTVLRVTERSAPRFGGGCACGAARPSGPDVSVQSRRPFAPLYTLMVILLSTLVTPGAAQAARSAS
jgi:hypothetical protein